VSSNNSNLEEEFLSKDNILESLLAKTVGDEWEMEDVSILA
jgi:hypothetical protein